MDFVLVGLTLLALYLALFRLILAPRDQSGQHKKPLATVALAVVVVLVMYRGLRVVMSPSAPITMMRSELAKFTGQDGGPIYLALRGRIYDVSSGRSHYGPGGGYAGFSGRDASRSFVDLCFTPECLARAHVIDEEWLAKKENRDAMDEWTKFYEEERDASGVKKYPFIGYVVDDTPSKRQ